MVGRRQAFATLLFASLLLGGCAGDYVARTRSVRRAYESYRPDEAVAELDKMKTPEIDRLLVLLDKGMILHGAGKFEESIKVLAEADRLSQQLDFTSVSETAKTLLSNEREQTYRGEDFEKLMISVLQALNYAELSKDDDALVEVRRVNERIRKMVAEEKKPYEQLAIARYLGGILYEDQGELDSAFIDYYEAYKLQAGMPPAVAEPILRLAKQTDREAPYKELKTQYPDLLEAPLSKDEGQVVVVIEAGRSPQKESQVRDWDGNAATQAFPVPIYLSRDGVAPAQVTVNGLQQQAGVVTSIEQVARVHLNDRVGRMVAKQVAGLAIKGAIATAAGAATKNEAIGLLAFYLLNANNVPDLRSWLSLPAEFQVARFRVPVGRHEVTVAAEGVTSKHEVEVRPRRTRLLVLRRY
ncbi:MAG TPA: hypothetical protein VEY30_04720 [Myxococcaceae bacterium]|nr:hypothetical protein [Myxococcaceae bacterium]